MKTCERYLLLAALGAPLIGCSTLQVVAEGDERIRQWQLEAPAALQAGDELFVTTRDGQRLALTVGEASSESITGSSEQRAVRLDYRQIARVERREFDTWPTLGLALLLIAVASYVSALSGLLPG